MDLFLTIPQCSTNNIFQNDPQFIVYITVIKSIIINIFYYILYYDNIPKQKGTFRFNQNLHKSS